MAQSAIGKARSRRKGLRKSSGLTAKRVARAYGLTLSQAHALLVVVGHDLAQLKAAAARLRFVRPSLAAG
jgi:hypothetical protein